MRLRIQVFLLLGVTTGEHLLRRDPDVGLNPMQIIARHKYPFEEHLIQTEDDYLVTVHRIPHGVGTTKNAQRVLILVPGALGSSADFLSISNKSLGFILADSGYDVWILNPRGTTWSRKHLHFDPDQDKGFYWNFSWHEIGYYDLPAVIDYALEVTQQKQVYYVGHSQGTTSFFVMAATRPEYNEKVRLMVALAPIMFLGNIPNVFLREISKWYEMGHWVSQTVGFYEFSPHSTEQKIPDDHCEEHFSWCHPDMVFLYGYDQTHVEPGKGLVITTNRPAGSSVKQMLHYGQLIQSGKFRQYDYGKINNNKYYNSPEPPEYNISLITAPIASYYSRNDLFASINDVKLFHQVVPNVVIKHLVQSDTFNHGDFLWGKNVVELVYNDVIKDMNGY